MPRPCRRKAGFQSTPSVGRATLNALGLAFTQAISIHALRGEGDKTGVTVNGIEHIISIHALRGEGDEVLHEREN